MAKHMLAVSSHQNNLILDNSPNINEGLQDKCAHPCPIHSDYFPELRTLVGLGFTAVLIEGSCIDACKVELEIFLRYRNILENQEMLKEISNAIGRIVHYGFQAFKILRYPRYYGEFIWALHRALTTFNPVPQEQTRTG